MAGRTIHLRLGGQTYRVVTSAGDEELARLAAAVEEKLIQVGGPGRAPPQAMLLAAMALAHDLEESRKRADSLAALARTSVDRILRRVDTVLEATAERGASSGAR